MANIVVVGSINIDLIITTNEIPKKGMTVFGESYHKLLGGKGANQAVSAARLGSSVSMIGCVGKDDYGNFAITQLVKEGIDVSAVQQVDNKTGVALVTVANQDNSIIVIEGANARLSIDWIKKQSKTISESDIVLVQFEIPDEVIDYVAKMCQELNVPLIINPAPYKPINAMVLEFASYIIPNKQEYFSLYKDELNVGLKKYKEKLIVTLGEEGVTFCDKNGEVNIIPSEDVTVVDTTGAGDTFNGAFAHAIANGYEIMDAIRFANKCSSIAIQKIGAQSGMPYQKDVFK